MGATKIERYSYPLRDILSRVSYEVRKATKDFCGRCGRGFLPSVENGHCPYCLREKEVIESFFDGEDTVTYVL